MNKNSNIYIAGHKGLVGSAIVRKLRSSGYKNIITINKTELDLTNSSDVSDFFSNKNIEYIFDAAAKVGGISANDKYSADFIFQNTMIQTNLIHNSSKYGIKKFLFLGSVCIYPKFAKTPVKEESLLCGDLEPTNEAYAISKIHGIKLLKAYNKQYGLKGLSLMPCNLYGINDNFHQENSHVIPSLIRKFHFNDSNVVNCWGDGTPLREFLYVDDLAEACVLAMKSNIENGEHINVGSGDEISIKSLAEMISEITNFSGEIHWNTSKPNGTPQRILNSSRIKNLGWIPVHSLKLGLIKSYEWFKENYKKD